jgi:archaellum component FlaC
VLKKIYPYIIGFIIGVVSLWAISSGQSNKRIDELSNTIAIGTAENNRLLETIDRLTERNRLDQTTIDGLRKQIISDNNITKGKLDKISSGLGAIAEGLGGTEGTIQEIIDGIESIKTFIKSIKTD